MGLFKAIFGDNNSEQYSDILNKLRNSNVTELVVDHLINKFSEGGEYYNYLISDSTGRSVYIKVYTDGVTVIEQSKVLVKTGLFSTNLENNSEFGGIGFGASGYSDLPNKKYAEALQDIIKERLTQSLPNYRIEYGTYSYDDYSQNIYSTLKINIKESAKASW